MTPLRPSAARDCFQRLTNGRAWNIALRTAHVAAMGVLLGGHAFDVPRERLLLSLWLTIGTGAGLGVLEAGPGLVWFHQGRGLMTLGKLLLIGAVPFFWTVRLPILLVVVVIASVGSHMPARFRYYSVLYRKVIPSGSGPGVWQLDEEPEDSTAETPKHPEELP
ncbi:MAG: hypothetical protein ABIP48_16040 [Planctomycetota bacterium]